MTNKELEALKTVVSGWRTKIVDSLDRWYGDPEAWYAIKYMPVLLAEVERLRAALIRETTWISCSERLPDDARDVLVWDGGTIYTAYYTNETGEWLGASQEASHWREMPLMPELRETQERKQGR